MSRRYVITQMPLCGKRPLVCAVCEEHQLLEVQIFPENAPAPILNNIYVGRVAQVVKSIGAAFIEIQKGCRCFLPLSDLSEPENIVYVKRISEKQQLSQGDELLVQVVRDAVKTKEPQVSTKLSLSGVSCVVTNEKHQFGISKKLDADTRSRLRETAAAVLAAFEEPFGLIVRTNAAELPEESLKEEICALQKQMQQIHAYAPHRSLYSKLYEAELPYLCLLKNQKIDTLAQVITDDAAIYKQLVSYADAHRVLGLQEKLCFYDDAQLDLYKLYALETQLDRALQKKVWLKSGANLVIEPTEALAVIDVNSAKNAKKKQSYFEVNLEAAREIAHQIRLRNLSGIIIIDFIDMKMPEEQQKLIEEMRALVRFDSVKTDVIDLTRLGLMELTRKKTRRPLHEQMIF